jgi:hypothetical protein
MKVHAIKRNYFFYHKYSRGGPHCKNFVKNKKQLYKVIEENKTDNRKTLQSLRRARKGTQT